MKAEGMPLMTSHQSRGIATDMDRRTNDRSVACPRIHESDLIGVSQRDPMILVSRRLAIASAILRV